MAMNLVRIPVVVGKHEIKKPIEENISPLASVIEDANVRLKTVSNKNLKYVNLDHHQQHFSHDSFVNKMSKHIAYLKTSLFVRCQPMQHITGIAHDKLPISLLTLTTNGPCPKNIYTLNSILVIDVETMFVHEVATNTTCKKAIPNETCFCYKCNRFEFNPVGRRWKVKQVFDKSVRFVDENDVCFMCMCHGSKDMSDIPQENIAICIDVWKRPIKR